MIKTNRFEINFIHDEFSVDDLDSILWQNAKEIEILTYWSGAIAPPSRRFSVRGLWSNDAIYIRFETDITEPLVVSDVPNLASKTIGLWNRDVCEVFIAPNARGSHRYFEFEIAPNGEWIDLAIEVTKQGRMTDVEYESGMASATRIKDNISLMAIKIPFSALGKTPKDGDVWLGNLFRCVGSDPDRGYLAWMPTMTAIPNFHVPERFGQFVFTRQ